MSNFQKEKVLPFVRQHLLSVAQFFQKRLQLLLFLGIFSGKNNGIARFLQQLSDGYVLG